MFTFVTLSYNQQEYICQHLESIRYQIVHYGGHKKCSLILADDCSQDQTMQYAARWLRSNRRLFEECVLYSNDRNLGIVQNYIHAVKKVRTEKYKMLAADDLYYTNNVFEAAGDKDILLTPAIIFDDSGTIHTSPHSYYLYQYCMANAGKNLKKLIASELSYRNLIQAPGVFLSTGLAQREELHKFLEQFTWIEDYPQWQYLFRTADWDFSVDVRMTPYILYRTGAGISSSAHSGKRSCYENELSDMYRMFRATYRRYPKWINPYHYIYYLKADLVELYAKVNRRMRESCSRIAGRQTGKRVKKYISYLTECAALAMAEDK